MTRNDDLRDRLKIALLHGSSDHYLDAALYDHEYKRRRDDVRHYRRLARELGGPVLDLGCGTGRVLVPLCRDGHEVVGVDASGTMLARCRARVARLPSARPRLVEADFRHLALGRRFRLVVCAFNTFMHLYERPDVERFLAVVRRHLAPGGRFAFDVMNPDLAWLSRDSNRRWARTRFRHPTTGERMIYETNLVYDAPLQLAFMKIYYRRELGSRREKVVRLTHRYFFPQELEALLHYNGYEISSLAGDFDGGELTTASPQLVLVCRARSPSRK